jgi:hypothetical protein
MAALVCFSSIKLIENHEYFRRETASLKFVETMMMSRTQLQLSRSDSAREAAVVDTKEDMVVVAVDTEEIVSKEEV